MNYAKGVDWLNKRTSYSSPITSNNGKEDKENNKKFEILEKYLLNVVIIVIL